MTEYKAIRIIDGKPRQVIVDKNGKIINKFPRKKELENLEDENCRKKRNQKYTNDELLNFLIIFREENGKVPTAKDFDNSSRYPSHFTYCKRFGNWNNALKFVEMDIDTRIGQGDLS